jgi:hypothetical protein
MVKGRGDPHITTETGSLPCAGGQRLIKTAPSICWHCISKIPEALVCIPSGTIIYDRVPTVGFLKLPRFRDPITES